MIVNAIPKGWEIIFQRAHGLLAGQLAYQWNTKYRPERWIETLAAITEHDDGQEPLTGSVHITEAGAPKDFTFQEYSLQQAMNITTIAQFKSRWVALLISKHMEFLYGRLRKKDKQINDFLENQVRLQKEWMKQLKVSKEQTLKAYNLLQWCDRCSLILTKNQLPEDEKALEVAEGPDGVLHNIFQRKDSSVCIEPWPFRRDHFTVSVEKRELNELQFRNDEELATALKNAEVRVKSWYFKKK